MGFGCELQEGLGRVAAGVVFGSGGVPGGGFGATEVFLSAVGVFGCGGCFRAVVVAAGMFLLSAVGVFGCGGVPGGGYGVPRQRCAVLVVKAAA